MLVNKNWEVTCKRYVGFIDIMGFKDMVLKNTHQEIYKMMLKIVESTKLFEDVEWAGRKNKNEKLVTTTNYSDSIMIYSKDDSYDSLHDFICTIACITEDLFTQNIPFKGAIAFGTMTLDTEKSIFFGQPLIDSYLLQEELMFYGIIVHATAEKEISGQKNIIDSLFLSKYLCPLKNGSSYHLTIYPMSADNTFQEEKDNLDFLKLLNSIDGLRGRTSGYLRKYIDNTESYMNFVRRSDR